MPIRRICLTVCGPDPAKAAGARERLLDWAYATNHRLAITLLERGGRDREVARALLGGLSLAGLGGAQP